MAVKTASLDKAQAVATVYKFFKWFQNCCNQSIAPTAADIKESFTENFHIVSNGTIVAKSAADYLKRLQKFQKKYSRFEISTPLEESLTSGNQLALHYRVDLTTHTGQNKQVFIIALATIEDHRIAKWVQVAHQIGTGDWDA